MPLLFLIAWLFAAPVAPLPAPTAAPSPSASPAPSSSPAPSISPAPALSPTPLPLPTPIVLPPNAPPQIEYVALSSLVWRSGETVSGSVITSTNVASVEVRIAGLSIGLPRSDYGRFAVAYTVPRVPPYLQHRYAMRIIARNASGASAERDLTVWLR